MEVAIIAKIRNGILVQYREQHDLSQRAAAKLAGINSSTWCAIECMRFDCIGQTAVEKVAKLVRRGPWEIMPEELKDKRLGEKRVVFTEVSTERLLAAANRTQYVLPHPIEAASMDELRGKLDDMLTTGACSLSCREREVIRKRFGLLDGRVWTLKEVAKSLGVVQERVRGIEMKAIKKLQMPAISRQLEGFLDGQ